MVSRSGRDWRGFGIGLLMLGVLAVLTAVRLIPSKPAPEQAPPEQFSAARALETLRFLLGDQKPRPNGSPEAAQFRERIEERLRQLHLEPSEQDVTSCVEDEEEAKIPCPRVRNIVARLEGQSPGPAVLLAAHSDSVAMGPGAADDGSGVAIILETVRALRAGPPLRNPVIVLITDGEEKNLLGARAFARSHPWMKDVGVVVNVEARGTGGPSRMFETSGPNGWIVRAMQHSLPKPVTSSLFPAIYDRMPNATDLTVFKKRGVPGVNFAFIGSAENYHTAHDDLAHLSPRSVQHQGESVLAMARAFAQADLEHIGADRRVYFDLLAWRIVSWPQGWTLPLAILTLAVFGVGTVFRGRRRQVRLAQLNWSMSVLLITLFVTLVVGISFISLFRRVGLITIAWVTYPQPAIAFFWLVGIAAAVLVPLVTARRLSAAALWSGVWLTWAVLAIFVASGLPGGSYLFLVPSMAAALVSILPIRVGRGVSVWLPAAVAGVLWFPLILAWYDALGLPVLFGLSLFVALLVATLTPFLAPEQERSRVGAYFGTAGV